MSWIQNVRRKVRARRHWRKWRGVSTDEITARAISEILDVRDDLADWEQQVMLAEEMEAEA